MSGELLLNENAMPPSILVTGASGVVGSAVLRHLLPLQAVGGARLVASARNEKQRSHFQSLGVVTVHLDFDDAASVAAAMTGIDRLFLATGYSVHMLVQSKTVLDAAKRAGVAHVVHLGALAEPGTRLAHYVWHAYVESYIEWLGLGFTHLQPNAFMQNILIGLRPEKRVLRHHYGSAPIGWIDVEDIARVAALALGNPQRHAGKAYRLSEEVLTMAQVAATISRVTGTNYGVDARPCEEFLPAILRGGMESTYATALAESVVQLQVGGSFRADHAYDTVREVTGAPGTRWEAFVERHLAAFIAPPGTG